MSRSTNASKGTPDDDEGRFGDDREELTDEASDAHGADDRDDSGSEDLDDVEDEASDVVDQDDAESDEDSDAADEEQALAASTTSASVAKRRSSAETARSGAKAAAGRPAQRPVAKKEERRGPIAAIVLFVRQVIAELRKVVTPTTKELGTYSAVVIVFVLIVMAYVGVLDFAVGQLVLWAFGG